MIQKKICMLGSFAVGKTSLVHRFVENMFSDKYLTTIGVKIEKKVIALESDKLVLIIWDISGENGFYHIQSSYLRGMSGYLLVVDKTRMTTLTTALDIRKKVQQICPDVPGLLLMNKVDLTGQWDIDELTVTKLQEDGWDLMPTSAKTGQNVEEAFTRLATRML